MYVAGEWVQVLMEKRWYLPRCCGCGPKELVFSLCALCVSLYNMYYVTPELNIQHNLNQQAHNTTNNIE